MERLVLSCAMGSGQHELTSFTLEANQELGSTKIDLSKSAEVVGKFSGLDALIHLAVDPSPNAPWEKCSAK